MKKWGKAMIDLFGQSVDDFPKKQTNTNNKKRAWENAFQRWSDKESQDGTTPNGNCGYGRICDYCTDNHIGRPCVRALNTMAREKHIDIDYNERDFERWF